MFGGVIAEYFVFSAVDTAKSKHVPSGLFGLHRKARFWTESSAPGGRREARNRFKRGAGGFPASVEIPSEIVFFRVGLSLRLSKDLSRAFSGDRYRILSKVARLSPVLKGRWGTPVVFACSQIQLTNADKPLTACSHIDRCKRAGGSAQMTPGDWDRRGASIVRRKKAPDSMSAIGCRGEPAAG